eukprot:529433-Amphidinium_carterae.1
MSLTNFLKVLFQENQGGCQWSCCSAVSETLLGRPEPPFTRTHCAGLGSRCAVGSSSQPSATHAHWDFHLLDEAASAAWLA